MFSGMFTEEELTKLQEELSGLPEEEQQRRIQEILSQMHPEEVSKISQQQCPFCLIKEGKIQAKIVYEDDLVMAVFDINPVNKGHVLLFPKQHIAFSNIMDDILTSHIFKVANIIINAVADVTGLRSNNIYVANGKEAGQNVAHAIIHLIPRTEGDKAMFRWEGQKISDNELDELLIKLNGKIKIKKEIPEVREEKKETLDLDIYRIP